MMYSTILTADSAEILAGKLANFLQSLQASNVSDLSKCRIISLAQSESITSHQERSSMPGGIPTSYLAWNGTITIIYEGRDKI